MNKFNFQLLQNLWNFPRFPLILLQQCCTTSKPHGAINGFNPEKTISQVGFRKAIQGFYVAEEKLL
jgi:hypothetical protein